jgi:tetratricopeptide (TPR) repeat protein
MYVRESQSVSRVLILAAILTLFALIAASRTASAADEAQQLLIQAQNYLSAGEVENAKLLYQQIIKEYPGTNYAGHAYFGLAKIHTAAQENEEALAALDKILEESASPSLLGTAVMQKVTLLIHRFNDYEQAIQLAEEQLPALGELMPPFDRAKLVMQLSYAYDKTDQPEQALAVYQEQVPYTPALLTYPLYYERMYELCVKTGRQDEALTVARLGYALCPFEQKPIEDMSNLVKKAYAARGEIFKATQFFAAQEDPEKPNPLLEAPMPEVKQEELDQLLAVCGDDCRLLVCSYLYAGDYEQAMMAAQDAMSKAPADDMLKALAEVARVFKAVDLNLVRANRFLSYAKAGEGENPLETFWQEAQ